jgi:hypothetical protein
VGVPEFIFGQIPHLEPCSFRRGEAKNDKILDPWLEIRLSRLNISPATAVPQSWAGEAAGERGPGDELV